MVAHRPWIVPIRPVQIAFGEERVIVLSHPEASTPSFRKLTLTGLYELTVESVIVGDGRNLLACAVPVALFGREQPEFFDVPIARGEEVKLTIKNPSAMTSHVAGMLSGLGPTVPERAGSELGEIRRMRVGHSTMLGTPCVVLVNGARLSPPDARELARAMRAHAEEIELRADFQERTSDTYLDEGLVPRRRGAVTP